MITDVPEVFAQRLRAERERAGLSQNELAARVSAILGETFYATAVTKVEKRDREVKLVEAVALSEAVGVPLVALLTQPDAIGVELERARDDLLTTEAVLTRTRRNIEQWTIDAERLRQRIVELEAIRSRQLA